jgi:hypothetical protein
MSTARSVFTEAIEDHLALKKQNATIETTMPLARYDVGDPLDRYPGGPNRSADSSTVVVAEDVEAFAVDGSEAAGHTALMVGPSPEQAMEAATALEPSFADRPFEPLTGMTPMLSLVEDIDEDEDDAVVSEAPVETFDSADVLRFPGGVGPREDAPVESFGDFGGSAAMQQTQAFTTSDDSFSPQAPGAPEASAFDGETAHEAPTGEQPVLVIDADEPLATSDWSEPAAPARSARRTASKPRFFGLGRKKGSDRDNADGWFTDGPRAFNWD